MPGNTSFRYLVRFSGLHKYVPAGATVLSAELTLSFVNYQDSSPVMSACFMAKEWQHVDVGPRSVDMLPGLGLFAGVGGWGA